MCTHGMYNRDHHHALRGLEPKVGAFTIVIEGKPRLTIEKALKSDQEEKILPLYSDLDNNY